MLLEEAFEGFGVDRSMTVGFRFYIDSGYLFDEQLVPMSICEVFLLEIATEERSADDTLYHSVHVASIAYVIQSGQFVQLRFLHQILRVELLKVIVMHDSSPADITLLVSILHCDTTPVLYLYDLASVHDAVD